MAADSTPNLKITLVGQDDVGKTTFVKSYLLEEFYDSSYTSVVPDGYASLKCVDDKEYRLVLVDTPGTLDCESMRRSAYVNSDCFILCYAINSSASFKSIRNYWLPELHTHCKGIPFILVATKLDLRSTDSGKYGAKCITNKQGVRLREKIKARSFLECSAKDINSLQSVIEKAVRAAVMEPKADIKLSKRQRLKSLFSRKK